MDGIENLFNPQMPTGKLEMCKTIIRQGLEFGVSFGEKLNEWIDDMFDLIPKEQ